MKRFGKWLMMLALVALAAGSTSARAKTGEADEDKTLSPYFLVTTENGEVEQFSLKSTSAEVNIAGVIADVVVTQVYQNRGKEPIECIYVFPASSRAAVYGMKMTIGERTIVAKIEERKKAREDYEKAKDEGKSASLLEEQRPNVFQMNVANIMPGDEIKVELRYTELLVPTDGVYEFAYPTVVGPRYSNQKESDAPENDKWVKNPYLHEGEAPPYTFDINVNLSAGMEIQEAVCDTHKTNIAFDGKSLAHIKLDSSEAAGGNKDYILRYRLAGGKIDSGLLLYEGNGEKFFLLMMQPPKRVETKAIPPREYIFVVDVSGSMNGFPLDISKKLLKDLIGNLRKTDKFNVVLFAGGNAVMSDKSLPATEENIQKAIDVIDNQQGGGGTELLPALETALKLPGVDDVSRTVVIVTDGYVNVEKEAFDLIRNNLGAANMFAFGIGSSVNRYIIEGMAHVGNGEPYVIEEPGKAGPIAEKFRKLIQTPVLTNIKVDWDEFDVYDLEPASVPDILAEKPVVIYGKYKGSPEGEITLTGLTGDGKYKATLNVGDVKPFEGNAAIRYLWARKRIQLLGDYNKLGQDDERVKEITSLGLSYNLLTEFTSFIAIDTEIRNKDGKSTTVNQPLPLPEGVSDYAVGPGSGGRGMNKMMLAPSASPPPMMREMAKDEEADAGEKEEPKPDVQKPKKTAAVNSDKVSVVGGMDKKAVDKLVKQEKAGLEQCYQDALDSNPSLLGKVEVKIEVDGQGNITKVSVTSADLSDTDFIDCLTKLIEAWTLPAPADGNPAKVTITLNFKPGV